MSPKGLFYISIATFTHGFTHVFSKLGLNTGVDEYYFAAVKMSAGALAVVTFWFVMREKLDLKLEKKYIKNLAIIGILASGVASIMIILSLKYTSPTNATVVQGLYGAFTMILAYFWLHERISKWFFPTLLVMISGLYLFGSKGLISVPNTGDWILIGTVPIVAFANVYAKETLKALHFLTLSFGRYIFGAGFLILLMFFFMREGAIVWSEALIWAVLSGVFGAFRVSCFYKAIEIEGPTTTSSFMSMAPVVTAFAAAAVLGERLNFVEIIGFSIVVVSAVMISRFKTNYLR